MQTSITSKSITQIAARPSRRRQAQGVQCPAQTEQPGTHKNLHAKPLGPLRGFHGRPLFSLILLAGILPQVHAAALPGAGLPQSKGVQASTATPAVPARKRQAALPADSRPKSARPQAEQLRAQAKALMKKGTRNDLALAAGNLRESARLLLAERLSSEAAADYLTLGEIYLMWSRFDKAQEYYRRALRTAPQSDIDLQCSGLSHLAVVYTTIGEIDQSLKYSRRAVDLSARSASPVVRAEAAEALGLGLLYAKDPEDSLKLFLSAGEMLKESAEPDRQAEAFLGAGLAYFELGSVSEALEQEGKALRLWESSGNIHGIARARSALGLLWATTGELDQALTACQQAARSFHQLGDWDNEANVDNQLGGISEQLGDPSASLGYFTKAWKILVRIGDLLGEIAAVDGVARAHWEMGRYREAGALYRKKLELATQRRVYRSQISALINLGDVNEHTGNFAQARAFYLQALEMSRKVKHAYRKGEALLHLGRLQARLREYKTALSSLNHAAQIIEPTNQVGVLAQIHYETARVYEATGDLAGSEREIKETIGIIESQRIKISDIESRASYFASVNSYYRLYIDVLMQLHKQHPNDGYDKQALEKSERSKVRSLLDKIGGPVAPALTLSEVQAEIRGDGAIVLEYELGDKRSYVWAIDEKGMAVFELAGSSGIQPMLARFHDALTARQEYRNAPLRELHRRVNKADSGYDKAAAELSRVLLGPVAHLLSTKRLIVVPDGLLHSVPFAALPQPANNGIAVQGPLAGRYEVISLPSISTLHAIRAAGAGRTRPASHAAIFADPVFGRDDPRVAARPGGSQKQKEHPALAHARRNAGLRTPKVLRLPESLTEAQRIVETMQGQNVKLALGFDANRPAVLEGDLGQYRYIHFATHGVADTQHPELSALILSLVNPEGEQQEGYLRLNDIYQLKLSADLVVLSSCSSALGKDLSSEGVIGLTRAFMSTGARSVIASLWKVEDEATSELMSRFYTRLQAGERPASALRGAQSDLARNPLYRAPFYWAAFILQGEYR